MKMIKVDDKVHEMAKENAKKLGMTLKGYMKMIIEKSHESM